MILNINSDKISLLQFAAIIIIFFSSVSTINLSISLINGFPFESSPWYIAHSMTFKSIVNMIILFAITFFICGIISGIGLYLRKTWSRPVSMSIAVFMLCRSVPKLTKIINPDAQFGGIDIIYLLYAFFAAWFLYYFNRSDIKEKFKNAYKKDDAAF